MRIPVTSPPSPTPLRDSEEVAEVSLYLTPYHFAKVRKQISEANEGRGGKTISTLASHQGEPYLIPGRVTGFSQVGIVPDDGVGRRGFLGDLPFPPPPLHSGAAPYSLQSPSSAMKTSMLTAAHISSFTLNNEVLRADEGKIRRECSNAGIHGQSETGDLRENPPTRGIHRHDSHLRKSGMTRPGIESGSPWWEASSLTAQPPRPLDSTCEQHVRPDNIDLSRVSHEDFTCRPQGYVFKSQASVDLATVSSREIPLRAVRLCVDRGGGGDLDPPLTTGGPVRSSSSPSPTPRTAGGTTDSGETWLASQTLPPSPAGEADKCRGCTRIFWELEPSAQRSI
ncbi:hypothetical protein PR048_031460 [Dryococelus australis]|uniref:Uncharacterized protein n=1 Tax=Dryococelus australis TaxID=614101 RepID=A0ABQ9G867_9NEOP|nr:hypothetical protein PR048_031460 [Dryococelus australis]